MSVAVLNLELVGSGCHRRYSSRVRRRRRRYYHLDCVSLQVLLLPPETSVRHAATTTVSGVCDATTTSVRDAATASRRRSRGGEIKEARGVRCCGTGIPKKFTFWRRIVVGAIISDVM